MNFYFIIVTYKRKPSTGQDIYISEQITQILKRNSGQNTEKKTAIAICVYFVLTKSTQKHNKKGDIITVKRRLLSVKRKESNDIHYLPQLFDHRSLWKDC